MSVRQGSNILAGGVVCDNTPTSASTNAVSSGGVYTALAGKVSIGHEVIEFQVPTAENNYTWYRKYADGWVEQGGGVVGSNTDITVNLPIEMSNNKYQVSLGLIEDTSSGGTATEGWVRTKTATNMILHIASQADGTDWQVSGMAAN